jgi:hypothetical protein
MGGGFGKWVAALEGENGFGQVLGGPCLLLLIRSCRNFFFSGPFSLFRRQKI